MVTSKKPKTTFVGSVTGSSSARMPGSRTTVVSHATREGTHTSGEAFISLAMRKLMVARLARDHP
jgi:hypothetical protein